MKKAALLGGEQFFVEAHFLMRGRRHRSVFFLLAARRVAAKGSSARAASSGQGRAEPSGLARPKGLALTRTDEARSRMRCKPRPRLAPHGGRVLPLGSPRFAGADGKDRQTGRARSDAAGGTTPHRLTGLGGRGLQHHPRGASRADWNLCGDGAAVTAHALVFERGEQRWPCSSYSACSA